MAIGGKFGPLLLLDDVQEMTDGFTERMNEVALETLGKARRVIKPWSNYKLVEKCEARRILKAQKNRSTEDAKKYREANNEVKKEIKVAKEK